MTEYINKAEALKKQYCIRRASLSLVTNDFNKVYARVVDAMDIEEIPPADVVPVIHARWRYTDAYPHQVYCSNCNKKFLPNMEWIGIYNIPTNYCPCCGAKMDESEDEE